MTTSNALVTKLIGVSVRGSIEPELYLMALMEPLMPKVVNISAGVSLSPCPLFNGEITTRVISASLHSISTTRYYVEQCSRKVHKLLN